MSAYKVCKGNALCRGTAGMKPVLMAAILAVAVGAVVFYAMRKNGLDTASPLGAGDAPHATTGTASGVELANSGAAGKPVSQTPQPKKTDADAKKADAKPTSNVILIGDRKQLKVRVIWKDTEQGVPGTSISVVQCQGNPDEIGGTAMTGMTGEAVVSFPMAWTGVHVQLHNPLIASQSPHVNCPPETEHVFKVERAAMIFGKVLYEDKRVAPEAKVRALQNSSLTATADAQGAYEIGGVPAGSYQLAASLGGFISDAGGSGRGGPFIDVKAGERKGPYDIILRPGLALSGVIRDLETAKPIADAEIGRLDRNQAQVDKDSIVKSAADGSWQLAGLPIGRVTIQASAKGYATDRTMVQMIGGAKNACELALEPGATVRVKVMDEASSPIAEARVYPNRDFGGARDTAKEIKTDALGMATLEGISALKPPNIQASKDNYYMNGAGALPVFPAGIRATDVTVTLRAVKKSSKDDETSKTEKFIVFKGRVTNSEGAGIPGAEVYWGYRYNIESDKPATSGDDGTYRLEIKRQSSDQGRSGADNYMAVFAKGYASAVKNQPDGGTAESPVEVNFKLEKGHFAAGVVVTAKGAPIEGLDAQMGYTGQSDENNLLRNSRQGRRQAHTDADGKFRFEDLSNRAVTVNLTGKGWTSLSNKALALDQETRIVMKEGGVIKGRVVEGDSQTPVKLFTVKARGARSWDESSRMGILFNSPDGAFTLYELEQDEDYSLRVSAQGFVSALQEELKAGPESDVKPVVFKLSRGQETKGVVLDGANQQPLAGATVLLYSATTEGGGFGRRSGSMVQFDNSPEEGVIRVLTGADGAFSFREGETLGYLAVKAPDFSPLVISANERDQYGGPRSLRIVMKRGGAVRGTVTLNGNPLPEANIYAYRTDSRNEINISSSSGEPQNNQVMTDASGAYRISGLAAGSYQLSVNGSSGKSSFSKSEKFDLTDGEEKLLDIAIGGGSGVLYGRVLKGTAPVPQANISVDPKRNEGGITRQSSTDGKGEYRIEGLEDGAYNANVNFSSGEDSSNLSEDVSVSGETQKDFTLPEKRKVTFKIVFDGVTDPTKAPTINNANLNIKDSFDSSDSSKKLDSYGYCHNPQDNLFTFRGRFKGAYRLNVQGQTGDNQQFNYQRPEALALDNLDADQDLGEIHLSFLTGSTLKGMVMDLTGKAIKDAGVTLTPETHMGGDSFSSNNSSTNEEGRYQIFGLRDGAYTARIYSYRSRSTAMQMSETVEIKGATEHDFILLQSFKVTAKLTAPKDPNFRLSDLQNASLARQGVRDDPGKDPLQITPYGNGEISKGQIVFTGRFMGDYALSVNVKNKNIRIPGTFKLDNMDHDQDLGEIPLPTMGTILLRISIPDASIKRPNYCQLMLLPAQPQPDGSGPVNQSQSSYSVDLSKAEQEIGPVPEGSYRAALTMDTWKGDPMVVPVTITAGERPIVAFSLKPWIVLSGSVAMPDGFPKDAMPSVIALSGPGGTRTVTPQKGKGPDTEARLLGKDWAWTIFFMFQNLQEGTWRLTVEAEGCLPFSRDCEVKLGEGMRNQVRVVLKSR